MSARKVTPQVRNLMDDPAYSTCIANLRAAGYVILSPDEVRGIRDGALEESAKVAEDASQKPSDDEQPGDDEWLARTCANSRGLTIAARIRSLKGARDAQ